MRRRGPGVRIAAPGALAAVALAAVAGAGCGSGDETPTITVLAATSATDVVTEAARAFEARTGTRVVLSFAASSTLARQIEQGAPADVFLSASAEWMEEADRRGLLEPGSTRAVASNRLVLVAPRGQPIEVSFNSGHDFARAFEGSLALGDPTHVPAGIYARQALESYGWWADVADRVLPASDVRHALRLVALGEAGAAIVYATDVAATDAVTVIAEFPKTSHGPITYPVGLCRGAGPEARRFIDFLAGAEARAIFARHSFAPP
ncbi:MAG: molybdate ABC transporter substrate-binding protein [Planctomycetota bacterium]|jgi:molybdate transport system substrate-binding protein